MEKVKDFTVSAGLTLIELLVTLSVASILLAVAAPGYRVFVQDSQLITQINHFSSAMMLAKNEAIIRNGPTSICPSTNGTGCTGGTVWSNGWIVFADADGDGIVGAGEEIIQVGSALTGGNTLASNGARVTFSASGFSLGFNATFSLCDSRGVAASKVLVLSNQGRVRHETGTGACS
ncbi:GspH/FimT family pseudopilin [Nitrosomonas aestuarii]|uniref:GspH/FimT family pseudopilin n=1 Tax=Nitrosomonas aestuarii TaxID=52441 RepID=UPI000D2F71AE|nr:GspH/FimT family pseudopilin [Nitrosomonas aestuarii]PTN12083.1 type IV fimbrial biogenesis protein FimT [Nitrosomonas aestuarii]